MLNDKRGAAKGVSEAVHPVLACRDTECCHSVSGESQRVATLQRVDVFVVSSTKEQLCDFVLFFVHVFIMTMRLPIQFNAS